MPTSSKFGGTRIPYFKVETELPAPKSNEVVAIHSDGSVRYFSHGNVDWQKIIQGEDVVGVVYIDVNGLTMPKVVLVDSVRYNSLYLKVWMTLRICLQRHVARHLFTVSTYRVSDATQTPAGYYKTVFAAELGLRAAL